MFDSLENFVNWNVGAWVLGYLVVGNGKGLLFSELEVVM
jgi:hypothetical protein